MTITQCKKLKVLPTQGTKVQTVCSEQDYGGWFVSDELLKNRRNDVGQYVGFVAGAGGDIWLVAHENDEVAAYSYEEVF